MPDMRLTVDAICNVRLIASINAGEEPSSWSMADSQFQC